MSTKPTVNTQSLNTRSPVWVPDPAELADLELLLDGAYAPLAGFLGAADAKSISAHGVLADGSPWPDPILLRVPAGFSEYESVELQDAEGAAVALARDVSAWSDGGATYLQATLHPAPERCRVLEGLRPPAAAVRSALPKGSVLAVTTRQPLHRGRLAQIRQAAAALDAAVLVLPRMCGHRPEVIVKAILAAESELPAHTTIVPVPLWSRADTKRDFLLSAHVAAAYGATHLLADPAEVCGQPPLPVVTPPPMVCDKAGSWLPATEVSGEARGDLSPAELASLLDNGAVLPEWFTTPEIAHYQAILHPPLRRRGFTVLFTGLSGAGKSTVARGVRDALALQDDRCVTLLDGDVVRRNLSAGLGFSPEDRSRNVRRIGYVAAEVTRQGGAAICAPIAPYSADRDAVRNMVTAVGEFVLIHVATPLAECERRDRKGLYAKARRGELAEFTGVSAPYEVPDNADLVLDTSALTRQQAVEQVMDVLRARGWVRPEFPAAPALLPSEGEQP